MNKQLWMLDSNEELLERLNQFERLICVVGENKQIEKFENETKLIDIFTDLHFFGISNSTIIQGINIDKKHKNLNPKILIFKNYDDLLNMYSGNIYNTTNVEKFIRTYAYPLVNNLSPTNYLYAVNNKFSFTALLLPKSLDDEKLEKLYEEFLSNAKKFRGKLFFMYGNFSDQQQTTLAVDFETEEKDLPAIFIQEYANVEQSDNKIIKRYRLSNIDPENLDTISDFFNQYKYGALKKFLRSEKLPPKEKLFVDNVYHLVRKNFDEIILNSNSDKYSLIYFVRRNCGPCNEYKKDFVKIAQLLKKESQKVNFGIIDGLMNEFDEFEIPGYPSVLLFKPG